MNQSEGNTKPKASSLRWSILRQALLRRRSFHNHDEQTQPPTSAIKRISRRTSSGFNLIPSQVVQGSNHRDVCLCYTLPIGGAPKLYLNQRADSGADLADFEVANQHNIDNTGLVCNWPSEEVLAYFCLSNADAFRSKRVVELGAGYGLAGLIIAATTEASEVVISDGNPLVVDYIQRNIDANSGLFGSTEVKAMTLHWDQENTSNISKSFDIIVASDCTFFKEFHHALAHTVKHLLRNTGSSEAIFFSPKRGDSLDKFLQKVGENGLKFCVTENYDAEVWKHHQGFMLGDDSWPSYDKDHCYPLLIRIKPSESFFPFVMVTI